MPKDFPAPQHLRLIDYERAIKTPAEIRHLKKGARILDLVFQDFKDYVHPGLSELELALWIEKRCAKYGVKVLAFTPIVASGPNTSGVHAWPSKRKVRRGDFVMLDFGVNVRGYCSDMTRTLVLGEPTKRQTRVYNAVLKAQLAAVKKVRPDVTGSQLDVVARKVLTKAKLNTKFPHNLGHGVGLAIHEWPRLGKASKDILKKNMVVTVEPGVYIKGWGGVRIEDMVLVTAKAHDVLTKSPKSLRENIIKVSSD
jgi:Xaa-Pro aminopeptidase